MLPIREGELKANDAVIYFDNICDKNGSKLTKSEKRTRLKEMMKEVYDNPEQNSFLLSDGNRQPLIVCRQNPGRAKFYYFNTVDAPRDEVLQAFAEKTGITFKQEKIPHKRIGELTANDAKQFLDNITENGRKLAGIHKLKKLHQLFYELYLSKNNVCLSPNGNIPIIVKRLGDNNKATFCLNTSQHRADVLEAFSTAIGAVYLKEKENDETPPEKTAGELTARDCARIFHNVPNPDGGMEKRDASSKLVKWFQRIYNSPRLNKVTLPNGKEIPLLVKRQSVAQRCVCLNSSDEIAKPFVIFMMAKIMHSDICLNNIKISTHDGEKLYRAIILLNKAIYFAPKDEDKIYYRNYAQRAYEKLSPKTDKITFSEWLKDHTSHDK